MGNVVVGAFRRAVDAGFVDQKGFGMHDELIAAAPIVAKRDPDPCLRGFAALAARSFMSDHSARLLA